MGKAERDARKAAGKKSPPLPAGGFSGSILLYILPAIFALGLATVLGSSPLLISATEGRCHFLIRVFFFFLLDATLSPLTTRLMLLPARAFVKMLPGANGEAPVGPTRSEFLDNDETLKWPSEKALASLPPDWLKLARNRPKQPFFLNHVRGSARCKQAAIRVGEATKALLQITLLSWLLDGRPVSAIGIRIPNLTVVQDLVLGGMTGTACILGLFCLEWLLGWIKIVQFFEVVAVGEWLSINLLWDVIFHLGVAVAEELPLRGWMLLNTAEACVAHLGVSAATSLLCAVAAESCLFALLHLGAPGASWTGLINLTIGGVAAGLNVVLSGGLAFPLAWHFCWNIFMGHLLGLSTSGIPMSCSLVTVVPHPGKEKLHGGRFGPEQSVLAPAAYVFTVMCLIGCYGFEHWRHGTIVNDGAAFELLHAAFSGNATASS